MAAANLTNFVAAGTTVLSTGPGVLEGVTVNTVAVTSSVKLYDNTAASGTVIATIATTAATGDFPFNGVFGKGLTVVITGAPDVTVRWRN